MKFFKKIVVFVAIAMLATNVSFADEPEVAKSISKQATYSVGEVKIPALGDENLATKHKLSDEQEIVISSGEPISYIYVIFDKPPQSWTMQYDTVIKQAGQYGFLHEFIALSSEQNKISLTFQKGTELCDIKLFSKGEVPANIQQWQPPLEDADMLLLPTHSDDEHVFFGGIMPYYAGEKKESVQVAYMNNHYGEWYRPHELLSGLWESGITAYPIIPSQFNDYYSSSLDHAKTLYNTDDMLAYQVELLRRFKPEVVIGHDINGEYGHGVHMLNTDLLMQAVELSGDATKYPESVAEYGSFDVPKTYLHLYEQNQLMFDIDTPLESFGGQTAYEVAMKSFDHHKSQLEFFTVNKGGKYDCRKYGLYRTTVGKDIQAADFFENIAVRSDDVPFVESSEASDEPTSSEEASSGLSGGIVEVSSELSDEDVSALSIFRNVIPIGFVILGVLVIILTMVLQNRKKAARIQEHTQAYRKLSGKDK